MLNCTLGCEFSVWLRQVDGAILVDWYFKKEKKKKNSLRIWNLVGTSTWGGFEVVSEIMLPPPKIACGESKLSLLLHPQEFSGQFTACQFNTWKSPKVPTHRHQYTPSHTHHLSRTSGLQYRIFAPLPLDMSLGVGVGYTTRTLSGSLHKTTFYIYILLDLYKTKSKCSMVLKSL